MRRIYDEKDRDCTFEDFLLLSSSIEEAPVLQVNAPSMQVDASPPPMYDTESDDDETAPQPQPNVAMMMDTESDEELQQPMPEPVNEPAAALVEEVPAAAAVAAEPVQEPAAAAVAAEPVQEPAAALVEEVPAAEPDTSYEYLQSRLQLLMDVNVMPGGMEELARHLGLDHEYLVEKFEGRMLDHINLREMKRYIDDKIEEYEGVASFNDPPPPPRGGGSSSSGRKRKTRSSEKGVADVCPILQMGYSNVECDERNIPVNQIINHISTHVATLMKRMNEAEEEIRLLKGGGNEEAIDLD
jgi:hypothetical protein